MCAPKILKALLPCLLLLGAVPAQERVSGGVDPRKNCGTYSVGVVLDRLGTTSPGFSALRDALETDVRGLTDMGKIATYLTSRGLQVSQSRRDIRPDSICIGTTSVFDGEERSTNHFVVVEPTSDDKVILYYPPLWASKRSWGQVRQELGEALLVITPKNTDYLLKTISYLLIALGGLASMFAWRLR